MYLLYFWSNRIRLDKGGKIINGGGTTVYLNEEKMINEEKIINGAGTTVYLHGKEWTWTPTS